MKGLQSPKLVDIRFCFVSPSTLKEGANKFFVRLKKKSTSLFSSKKTEEKGRGNKRKSIEERPLRYPFVSLKELNFCLSLPQPRMVEFCQLAPAFSDSLLLICIYLQLIVITMDKKPKFIRQSIETTLPHSNYTKGFLKQNTAR